MKNREKSASLGQVTRRSAATASPGAKRNSARAQESILKAAELEFARHGYSGARIDKIAKRARLNMRMIYHYFGSKEKLYVACLERIYKRVRTEETQLDLTRLSPSEGMVRLVSFTFDHLLKNPEFVRIIMNENLLQGRYLKKSKLVPALTLPLVEALRNLLKRGEAEGSFRKDVDPVDLYVTILAVSNIHLSNRYTLSAMFQTDFSDPGRLEARREHARSVIMGYLRPEAEGSQEL